ncbi:MAG: Rrf2 family transcriptional regulator [Candidatus Hydrogenedentota bacterium]|nr:MAG: Rrf2 family transcriptional regulator [Candidatus Hydrogenedentota bacterium]
MMFTSATAEYALRAMARIGQERGRRALRSREISADTGVPAPYLSKILRKLVQAGLLKAQKGHHGGFRPARPLHKIRIIDVLKAVDEWPPPGQCVFGWGECDLDNPCPLHPVWSLYETTFREWARSVTFGYLSDWDEELRRKRQAKRTAGRRR